MINDAPQPLVALRPLRVHSLHQCTFRNERTRAQRDEDDATSRKNDRGWMRAKDTEVVVLTNTEAAAWW